MTVLPEFVDNVPWLQQKYVVSIRQSQWIPFLSIKYDSNFIKYMI